jgi:transcriptional regulator with XRE-family HTH domain
MTSYNQGGASAGLLTREMQIALIEAYERGDDGSLVLDWLGRYPHLSDEIVTFMVALRVVDGPEPAPMPEVDAAVTRGMALGMQRIQALALAAAPALREALANAGVTKQQLARQVGIAATVIDKFVQGKIALATVPQRFLARVAQALHADVAQVRQWAEASYALQPALLRAKGRAPGPEPVPAQESFADAVRACSPKSMPAAQRDEWLREAATAAQNAGG